MHFSKMHGLGNDFMVIDAITQYVCISSEIIQRLSDRHRGIGFDQLLIVEPSYNLKIDFHYRIFNADGSEVAQCGNGARCFAHFVHIKNLTNKKDIYVSTKTGHMVLTVIKYGLIRVNMGKPNFHTQHILYVSNNLKKNKNIYNKKKIICNIISIGNPHCVIIVENIETAPVKTLGPLLEMHNKFPERVNISFMQILNRKQIRLRVYERGSGETQACGSGACAAVAIGILHGKLDENVQVEFIGGHLKINWTGPEYPIYMTGPATHVYDGFINL